MRKSIPFLFLFSFYTITAIAAVSRDSVQRLLDKVNSDTARIRILLSASNSSLDIDPELGLVYAQNALELSQKEKNKKLEALSYYRLGTNAYITKTLAKSHSWFLKAIHLYEELQDHRQMAMTYSALGDVIGDEGDGKKSLSYYRLAKTHFLISGDTVNALFMDMSVSATLGSIMNMYDSSIHTGIAILPAARRTGNEALISMLLANIAGMYLEKGEFAQALNYYFQSLPYFEKRGDPELDGVIYKDMSDVYLRMKNFADAEKYGRMAYENYKKAKSMKGSIEAMQLLGNIFKEKKDFEKAADWYRQASVAKDSLFKSDMATQIADMQTKYETEKKDKALAVQEARLERQRLIIYGSIGILFLILTASLILFVNFRKIRLLSKELAVQKLELEELNAIKDKLFSAISHDLRSPLGRITNMLYLMQRGKMTEEKLTEKTTEFLGAMQQTMQMLDNLLYWATSQMKGLSLNRSNVRIKELVDENVELMQSEATLKKIKLIEKIEDTATALADVNMARLILRNLISNAIKFTPENGSITISVGTVSNKVQVEVRDTGIGMSPETVEALQANKQVNSRSGTKAEKGFGIGLQLCKDFIVQNGGKLEITSEPGKGSTFSFTLPVS